MKIKDIGEFELINLISNKPKKKEVIVGIGDDAAVIKTKKFQLLTTDCLIEDDHFNCKWFSPDQIGKKAIEINVSDIAAMGGTPKFLLISLALPKNIEIDFVKKIYQGMWKTCKKYDIEIIGGNMAHSNQIMISVTLTGEIDKKNLSLRSNAEPGDFLVVSGHLGFGRAGLRLFQENISGFNKVKKKYLEPGARLKNALKLAPYVNSMIDISDGLASEVRHICQKSKCGAVIYKEKIPIDFEVKKAAKTLCEDEYDYALYGGEDFELLFSVSKSNIKNVKGFIVGEIIKKSEIKLKSFKEEKTLDKKGYDHFSNTAIST